MMRVVFEMVATLTSRNSLREIFHTIGWKGFSHNQVTELEAVQENSRLT